MKRILNASLFLTSMFMLSYGTSIAQTDSKNVTLNVVLNNAVSIIFAAGGAGEIATLTYSTPDDYLNGVTLAQAAAFTASSTQAYTIKVTAAGDLVYTGTAGANTGDIAIGNVSVVANATGTTGVTFATAAALSTSDLTLITSDGGTTSQVYGLTYSTVDGDTNDFINKAEGTYSTTLTYTITAP